MKDGTDWSPRIALFGDLGYVNAQSVPRLINDSKKEMYDAIFHVGKCSNNKTLNARLLARVITGCHYT
jgi:hypothetical protein